MRLEPTWSSLGQAAGLAAHLSIKNAGSVTAVKVSDLQNLLISNKAKLIYVSDVDADKTYFKAVQYFGLKGFYHDLYKLEDINLLPLKVHKLQYRDASMYHNIEPEKTLDAKLADHWIDKLPSAKQKQAKQIFTSKVWTRAGFLNAIYEQM